MCKALFRMSHLAARHGAKPFPAFARVPTTAAIPSLNTTQNSLSSSETRVVPVANSRVVKLDLCHPLYG
jgi:hypothetical protein